MAIRKEDWPAINQAIGLAVAEAVAPLNPRGWRKALHVLRELAPLGGILTLVVALVALVVTLGIALVNRSSAEASFRGKTEEKLGNIDRELTGLRALVASSQPNRIQNQDAARELLAEARKKAIPPIPAPIVEQSGKSFVDASSDNPGAWAVALDFVTYQSALNISTRYLFGTNFQSKHTDQVLQMPDGALPPDFPQQLFSKEELPIDKAAFIRLTGISRFFPPQGELGNAWLLLRGGKILLDNMELRRVIFDHVEIHYNGKPLKMDTAVFIECRFVISNDDSGRLLAKGLLTPSTVNFQSPG